MILYIMDGIVNTIVTDIEINRLFLLDYTLEDLKWHDF